MKKIVNLLILVVLNMRDNGVDHFIYDYYLSNNENQVFDVVHDAFPIPAYNYARPFEEDLSSIALDNEKIEAILPYYPMVVSVDEKETIVTLSSEEKQKDIMVPHLVSNDYFPKIDILSYTNESLFKDALSVEKLASDSGIYVTEQFIDACDFDIQNKDLSITVTLSIPLSATICERENDWIEEETKIHIYSRVGD